MKTLHRLAATLALAAGTLLTSGCTTTLVMMHVYDKLTDGDPTSCWKLNSVERVPATLRQLRGRQPDHQGRLGLGPADLPADAGDA
jgi:hypothetical protein